MAMVPVALLLAACTAGKDTAETAAPPAPPAGSAIVQRSCAPNDGLAYTVILGLASEACEGEAGGAYLVVDLYGDGVGDPAGHTWDLTDPTVASAHQVPEPSSPTAWLGLTAGTLTIDTFDDAGRVTGDIDVILDGGEAIAGPFDANGACITELDPPMCG